MTDRDEREEANDEVPGLRGLRMHAQPERDLWPAIATRIALKRSRNRNVFLAAAACTLIVISAMLSLRVTQAPAPISAPLAAPPEYAAMTMPRADLRANRQLVKANLRLTQNAESEVRKALRQSPDDPSLQRLLASAHEQKRELHDLLMADRD